MSSTNIAQSILCACLLVLGTACTQNDAPSSSGAGLTADDMAMLDAPQVDCNSQGNPGEDVDVGFECEGSGSGSGTPTSVDILSCKDLSNVVIRFTDGSTQKFDGLSGRSGTFAGTGRNEGKEIDSVYVKSGNNKSYEGPGYGERFNAPDSCFPGDGADSGSSSGDRGDGTLDDDCDGFDDDGDGKIDEDMDGDGHHGDGDHRGDGWDGDGDGRDDDGDGKIDEDYRGDGWDGDGDGRDDDGDGKIDEDYRGDGTLDDDNDGIDDDGDGKIDEDYVGDGSSGDGDGGIIIR